VQKYQPSGASAGMGQPCSRAQGTESRTSSQRMSWAARSRTTACSAARRLVVAEVGLVLAGEERVDQVGGADGAGGVAEGRRRGVLLGWAVSSCSP